MKSFLKTEAILLVTALAFCSCAIFSKEAQKETPPPKQELTSDTVEQQKPVLPVKPTPTLIAEVQTLLRNAGYKPGPADGKMGKVTVNALKKFQEENGISPTGKINQETIEKLRAVQSATKNSPKSKS
jgi:peptidoglycan hydrolase-like protein with peptidoglycan-binding domain